MRLLFISLLGVCVLGCNVNIPNGVFGCFENEDCPSGFECWSDSRCYDTPDPGCQPLSCDQIVDIFSFAGVTVECGDLPDGCGSTQSCSTCEDGESCGATAGSNPFLCCVPGECEADPCIEAAAQCGSVGGALCGECADVGLAAYQCVDNQCVCDDPFEPNNLKGTATNLCTLSSALGLNQCTDGRASLPVQVRFGQETNALKVTFHNQIDPDWFLVPTGSLGVEAGGGFEDEAVETFIGLQCTSGQTVVSCEKGKKDTFQGVQGCFGDETVIVRGGCGIVNAKVDVFVRAVPNDWEPECQTYQGSVRISPLDADELPPIGPNG